VPVGGRAEAFAVAQQRIEMARHTARMGGLPERLSRGDLAEAAAEEQSASGLYAGA
jgi:hypothetical protein